MKRLFHRLMLWLEAWVKALVILLEHWPVVVLAALPFVFASGVVGRGFGIPSLFWHEDAAKQFLVGLVWSVSFAVLVYVGYVLDAGRNPVPSTDRERSCEPPSEAAPTVYQRGWREVPPVRQWIARFERHGQTQELAEFLVYYAGMTLTLLLCFVLASKLSAGGIGQYRHTPWLPLGFAAGIGAAVVLGWLASLLTLLCLPRWEKWLTQALDQAPRSFRQLYIRRPDIHLTAVIVTLMFTLLLAAEWVLAYCSVAARVPAVAFCTLTAVLGLAYGGLRFMPYAAPVVTAGLITVVVLWHLFVGAIVGTSYRHRLRGLSYEPPRAALKEHQQREPDPGILLGAEEMVEARRRLFDESGDRRLVVVCASGGGITAAVWTLSVLYDLEEKLPDLSGRTAIICGASGGMIGGACYVANLTPPDETPTSPARPLVDAIARDALGRVVHHHVFHDGLRGLVWPGPVVHDRGTELEYVWRDHLNGLLEVPFAALAAGEQAGWRPSLIFSPMMIEDGRRLLISNIDLSFIASNLKPEDAFEPAEYVNEFRIQQDKRKQVVRARTGVMSVSAVEYGRLFEGANGLSQLRLATAARVSAAFPYVSPAAYLPTEPPRRVVDAGYYDNFGVNIACSWLSETWPQWSQVCGGVLLIQIDASQTDEPLRQLEAGAAPSAAVARIMEGLTGPVQGLLAARQSVMCYRNDEQVEELARKIGPARFRTIRLCCDANAPLSWSLTAQERDRIKRQAEDAVARPEVAEVLSWQPPPPPDN